MDEFDYLKKSNLQKKINRFVRKYKNKPVIVYGAGKLSNYIFKNYDLTGLNIVSVADKCYIEKPEKFYGINGIAPEDIKNIKAECIIIFNLKPADIINYIDENITNGNIKIEWILKPTLSDYIADKLVVSKPKHEKNKKYIFTFWEPKNKIPAYIKLCIETWHKFLPEYEIVLLDYSNLDEWLDTRLYDKYLFQNFSLPKQADALRAALLYEYGGIWLDADTIITSDKIHNIINQNSEITMFNTHIGFIVAKRGAKVLRQWIKGVKKNIFIHKLYRCFPELFESIFPIQYTYKLDNWNYLGNLIIDKIKAKSNEKDFSSLERTDYFALPENNYFSNSNLSYIERYLEFFFKNDYSQYVLDNQKGIIMLHNSWTPIEYKNMSENEFLSQDITLAKILKP